VYLRDFLGERKKKPPNSDQQLKHCVCEKVHWQCDHALYEGKNNSSASSEWAQCIAQAHKYKMELESNRNLHPLGLEIARGD